MGKWDNCKNILCIRADNMGDVLMSSPAMRALKKSFQCRITLLTSVVGSKISPFIPEIDEVIIADVPWVKTENVASEKDFFLLIEKIKNYSFDAAVIFTVYSQNPLPAAMMAYLAGIPLRLAYCRENPYYLLTDWVVEEEPYAFIQHQVQRDLFLISKTGAAFNNDSIKIVISENATKSLLQKMAAAGVQLLKKWLVIHPGVSELKREYPAEKWIQLAKLLRDESGYQILVTGTTAEQELINTIAGSAGEEVFSAAGLFSLEELIALIQEAPLLISVNTGTVHIAAATQTPVIVLYALTNPQHTPWKVLSKVLPFSVKENLKSKNAIVNYVSEHCMQKNVPAPSPDVILQEAIFLLHQSQQRKISGEDLIFESESLLFKD